MAATSYGGAHLPDPGPDAAEERQKYARLDNAATKREKEMMAMVEQIDGAKEQLRIENDPKAAAKKQKSGAMALVGVTNGGAALTSNLSLRNNLSLRSFMVALF